MERLNDGNLGQLKSGLYNKEYFFFAGMNKFFLRMYTFFIDKGNCILYIELNNLIVS